MTASDKKTAMTDAELRKFGLVTGAILIGLIGCFLPWLKGGIEKMLHWLLYVECGWWCADRLGTAASSEPHSLLQTVDEAGRRTRLHQHAHYFVHFVLRSIYAHGLDHATHRQRPHAPPAQRRSGHLPRDPQQSRPPTYGETLLMLELLKDFAGFMKERKKYWLAPIVIVLLLLGLLIVFAHGSAVAPFIYTLF